MFDLAIEKFKNTREKIMTLSTRSIVSRILFLIGSLLSSTSLVAATLSFSGDFTQDDQVELFSFSVDVPSLVLIKHLLL